MVAVIVVCVVLWLACGLLSALGTWWSSYDQWAFIRDEHGDAVDKVWFVFNILFGMWSLFATLLIYKPTWLQMTGHSDPQKFVPLPEWAKPYTRSNSK